jgi:membrane-bound lytic murein transglycosylase D
MSIRRRAAVAALLALSAFAAAAAGEAGGTTADETFPRFETIQGNVEFWIRVLAEWRQGQAAVHDSWHPELVYEVVDLPGAAGEGYTEEQKDFLAATRERWERFLRTLEDKVAAGQPLEEIERQWLEHMTGLLGPEAVRGAHGRVRTQRGLRERFQSGLERSARYDRAIRDILRECGLPEDLAFLPHVESSFQPHARSSAGAVGLWQLTAPAARRHLRITGAIDERLDPLAASRGAAAYLTDAFERLGSWPLAVTSYNHGVEGMTRAKERFGTDFDRIYREYDGKLFGFASRNFYAEFLAVREVARDPQRFFPEGLAPEAELDLDSVVLDRASSPGRIATSYGVAVAELARLNPAWSSRAVRHGLALPAGTAVWLPPGTLAARPSRAKEQASGWLDGEGLYVVQQGDTLSAIAAAHGMPIDALREINEIPHGSTLIRAGQRLRVAETASSRRHVVRRGETLWAIAASYGVRLVDLVSANTLNAKASIHPGQILLIP